MIQLKIFALVLVAALIVGESSLRRSDDQARSECVPPIEGANAVVDRTADATAVAGANSERSASIAARIEQEEYHASQTACGLQAPNRAHNLRTYFREGGIDVTPRHNADEAATWQVTWRTSRWGRAGRLEPVEPGTV